MKTIKNNGNSSGINKRILPFTHSNDKGTIVKS